MRKQKKTMLQTKTYPCGQWGIGKGNSAISKVMSRWKQENPWQKYCQTLNGKELIQNLLFDFFSNFRTQDGKLPSLNYVTKLRSSINNQLIEEHKLDLTNRESFPEFHHEWRKIASQFKGMECKQCGKEFSDTRTLEYHQRKHHNEIGQFECEKCGHAFSRAWRLKTHLKTHMNIIQ